MHTTLPHSHLCCPGSHPGKGSAQAGALSQYLLKSPVERELPWVHLSSDLSLNYYTRTTGKGTMVLL